MNYTTSVNANILMGATAVSANIRFVLTAKIVVQMQDKEYPTLLDVSLPNVKNVVRKRLDVLDVIAEYVTIRIAHHVSYYWICRG